MSSTPEHDRDESDHDELDGTEDVRDTDFDPVRPSRRPKKKQQVPKSFGRSKPQYDSDSPDQVGDTNTRDAKAEQEETDREFALKLHTEFNRTTGGRSAAVSAQQKIIQNFSQPSPQPSETPKQKAKKTKQERREPKEMQSTGALSIKNATTSMPDSVDQPASALQMTAQNSQAQPLQQPDGYNDLTPDMPQLAAFAPLAEDNLSIRPRGLTSMHQFRRPSPDGDWTVDATGNTSSGLSTGTVDNDLQDSDDEAAGRKVTTTQDSNESIREENESEHEEVIDCLCKRNVDNGRAMSCCDFCHTWQHNRCTTLPNRGVNNDYLCYNCNLKVIALLQLQDWNPFEYEVSQSPLKRYVPIWRALGRTDIESWERVQRQEDDD